MFEDDYENESDVEQAGLSEQAQRQLAKEQRLIEDLETDAAEHPFEEDKMCIRDRGDAFQQVSRRAQRFQIPDDLPRIGAPFPLCIFQSVQFL